MSRHQQEPAAISSYQQQPAAICSKQQPSAATGSHLQQPAAASSHLQQRAVICSNGQLSAAASSYLQLWQPSATTATSSNHGNKQLITTTSRYLICLPACLLQMAAYCSRWLPVATGGCWLLQMAACCCR